MDTKIKLLNTIVFAICFFAGCNNEPKSTTSKDTASPIMVNTKYDTTEKNLNGYNMKSSDSILFAMNKMINRIGGMKISGDVDVDFANRMIEHHKGAIDMCLQEIKSGTDAGIKSIAKEIIRNQMDEQSTLGNFAKDAAVEEKNMGKEGYASIDLAEMNGIMNSVKLSGNIDKDFVILMISHHESEIKIAKNELSSGIHNKLKEIANKIVSDQTREIVSLTNWLSITK